MWTILIYRSYRPVHCKLDPCFLRLCPLMFHPARRPNMWLEPLGYQEIRRLYHTHVDEEVRVHQRLPMEEHGTYASKNLHTVMSFITGLGPPNISFITEAFGFPTCFPTRLRLVIRLVLLACCLLFAHGWLKEMMRQMKVVERRVTNLAAKSDQIKAMGKMEMQRKANEASLALQYFWMLWQSGSLWQ